MAFPICTYNNSSANDSCPCYNCANRRAMSNPLGAVIRPPPDTPPQTSYADYPKSVTELKSKDSDNAALWTPRDAVISFLRRLDEGEFEGCDTVVIFATYPNKNPKAEKGTIMTHFSCASPTLQHTLGAIELGRLKMHNDGEK